MQRTIDFYECIYTISTQPQNSHQVRQTVNGFAAVYLIF